MPQELESAFKEPLTDPIATMFTVPSSYNFHDPACKGIGFICWPTVGVSGVEHYESKGRGIPGWNKVLLVTTLKRSSLYVLPLKPDGRSTAGRFERYFRSENRFRDTAVSLDGKTIYIATDTGGLAEGIGGPTVKMQHPGAILAFTYTGEGTSATTEEPPTVSETASSGNGTNAGAVADGVPPQFSADQAAKGKTAYNSTCAVCHGTTMTNGAYGTPLAGEYFKTKWTHQTTRAFYDRALKTTPPAAPGSLPAETYAYIVAYILEVNGFKAGDRQLPGGGEALDKMVLK